MAVLLQGEALISSEIQQSKRKESSEIHMLIPFIFLISSSFSLYMNSLFNSLLSHDSMIALAYLLHGLISIWVKNLSDKLRLPNYNIPITLLQFCQYFHTSPLQIFPNQQYRKMSLTAHSWHTTPRPKSIVLQLSCKASLGKYTCLIHTREWRRAAHPAIKSLKSTFTM